VCKEGSLFELLILEYQLEEFIQTVLAIKRKSIGWVSHVTSSQKDGLMLSHNHGSFLSISFPYEDDLKRLLNRVAVNLGLAKDDVFVPCKDAPLPPFTLKTSDKEEVQYGLVVKFVKDLASHPQGQELQFELVGEGKEALPPLTLRPDEALKSKDTLLLNVFSIVALIDNKRKENGLKNMSKFMQVLLNPLASLTAMLTIMMSQGHAYASLAGLEHSQSRDGYLCMPRASERRRNRALVRDHVRVCSEVDQDFQCTVRTS
jgi:hypothetical protein